MAKMFALTQIIMPDNIVVPRRTVFDCTPTQAKQFDALKAARPATPAEIQDAAVAHAKANGIDLAQPQLALDDTKAPPSKAPGDPLAAPKGKST